VFWASGTVTLAGAGLAFLLPGRHRGHFSLTTPAGMGAIAAPVLLFLMTAGSFGAATTFLPVAVPDADVSSLALLAASTALVLARLAAGAIGDRHGAGKVLLTAVLVSAGGLALIAVSRTTDTGLLLLGAALLGAGFGAAQNDSFVLTVQRLGEGRSGTASTIWNVAYDGGLGLGAIALGWVAGHTGYAGAFLAMAAIVAAGVLALARLPIRRRTRRPRP
jgi:MFS family permease